MKSAAVITTLHDMASPNVANTLSTIEQSSPFEGRESALTRKVLWKLDTHVLSLLALVSHGTY